MADFANVQPDEYKLLGRNFSAGRPFGIKGVTIHHMAGDLNGSQCNGIWKGNGCSAHYSVDRNGYIVQAIKTKAMTGNVARWTAIAVSAGCGALTAMSGGVPTEPSAWVTSIFAAVGGVQVAYAAFKSVGITDKWLDALLALGDIKED